MAYELHFTSTVYPVRVGHLTIPAYAALWALFANLVVAVGLSAVLHAMGAEEAHDATLPEVIPKINAMA